jgi:3-oxoacyl-[acyl-carrier-protein] synthase III
LFFEGENSVFAAGFLRMLGEASLQPASIDLFQVNLPSKHIAESVMDECIRFGMKRESFYTKLDTLGYCGPPMVFICLDSMVREEAAKGGARVASFVTEVSKFMQAGYVMTGEGS